MSKLGDTYPSPRNPFGNTSFFAPLCEKAKMASDVTIVTFPK
ncbi:hypothetical protein RLPCCGM1_p1543 [Rhizobium leguminosarum bv. phaseoli CCGM1]|nr:hypothetical protein RLPCCGM1_p1543 [Rhizobium leguminosarum bv. phaseoli CCGM1]